MKGPRVHAAVSPKKLHASSNQIAPRHTILTFADQESRLQGRKVKASVKSCRVSSIRSERHDIRTQGCPIMVWWRLTKDREDCSFIAVAGCFRFGNVIREIFASHDGIRRSLCQRRWLRGLSQAGGKVTSLTSSDIRFRGDSYHGTRSRACRVGKASQIRSLRM